MPIAPGGGGAAAERRKVLRAGDAVTVTCNFDTTNVVGTTRYGVDHGDEMCGPLLLYYPTDAGVRFTDRSLELRPFT